MLALPIEFSHDENIALSREYIEREFVSRGMVADFALHDTSKGNPHAHIMLTTREVGADGFGKKNRDWNSKNLLIS